MRRTALTIGLIGLSVVLLAGPATAKGEHEGDVSGQAVITGPGLDEPIVIEGLLGEESEFQTFLLHASLIPSDAGYYGLEPDPSSLGPRYEVVYTIEVESQNETGIIHQDLYPFAQDGPLFLSAPGQESVGGYWFSARLPSAWWHAPHAVLPLLISQGLPAVAPRVIEAPRLPQQPPVEAPALPDVGPGPAWILFAVMAGLSGLLVLGIRTRRRRAVLS